MKTLFLFRHGKAESWDDADSDFHRHLTKGGIRKTKKVASHLKKQGIVPDLLVSSPAYRAKETAQAVAEIYNIESEILEFREIYFGNETDSLLHVVHRLPQTSECVMMFGHNPGFTEFAEDLSGNFPYNMPKSGAAGFSFTTPWSLVKLGSGKLTIFDSPKSITSDQ